MPERSPPPRNVDRFLDAFSAIERLLRQVSGESRSATFHQIVARAADRNAVVRHFADDLREYADLRNAIVHERRGSRPIAEPLPEAVAEIEAISARLYRPPQLHAHFRKKVLTCTVDDMLRVPLLRMRRGNYSQVPAYSDHKFVGLLTFETTARWLAAQLETNEGLWEEPRVKEVLAHAETSENVAFLTRTATVYDALDLFAKHQEVGRSLYAILVTESGKTNETPLGIVTPHDIPTLLADGRANPRT